MKKNGFYIIKDDFFAEVNDPYLKGNKEQNRPHYYCFEDSEIEREYTIAGNPMMLTSEHVAREIEKRARRVVGLLKRGIKFTPTQPDIAAILAFLKARQDS